MCWNVTWTIRPSRLRESTSLNWRWAKTLIKFHYATDYFPYRSPSHRYSSPFFRPSTTSTSRCWRRFNRIIGTCRLTCSTTSAYEFSRRSASFRKKKRKQKITTKIQLRGQTHWAGNISLIIWNEFRPYPSLPPSLPVTSTPWQTYVAATGK